MKKSKIANVFGIREYKVQTGGCVKVVIGKPVLCSEGESIDGFYCCHFQITGIGDDQIMTSCGIDEIASIISAFKMVGARLHSSQQAQRKHLNWEGEVDNDVLGFPEP
jgi:hypothetical protein